MAGKETVNVCCRFRPENAMEKANNSKIFVEVPNPTTVKVPDHTFNFDRVFRWDAPQKEVYEYAAKPIVNDLLNGFNGTVFAYGQTGSGKTFTMEGPDIEDDTNKGVIPRMVFAIFQGIGCAHEDIEFQVKVSMVEIYNERIKDLIDLKKDNLQIREDHGLVYMENITEISCACEDDVFEIMRHGHKHRSTGATNMNEHSSRSHMVFMMKVIQTHADESKTVGKLHLIDLAGSEKVGKTGSTGERLQEAQNINKSLSALGLVIHALTDKSYTHIPYRDSKLTRILQDSLGGNSKTSLIVTCSPSNFNDAETISTLRFGERAKSIKNNAKVNHDLSPTQLKNLLAQAQARINILEQLLQANGIAIPAGGIKPIAGLVPAAAEAGYPAAAAGTDVEFTEQLQSKRDELKANAKLISELNRTIGEMQAQLDSHNDEMQRVQDRLDKMEYNCKDKADEVNRLQLQLDAVRKENEELTSCNTKLANMSDSSGGAAGEASQSLSPKNDVDKRKVAQLDKKLESFTIMYHKLATQNTSLKVECSEASQKIQRRDQRIGKLEHTLSEAKQKYEKLLTQCSKLTAAMPKPNQRSNIIKSVKSSGGLGLSKFTEGGVEV